MSVRFPPPLSPPPKQGEMSSNLDWQCDNCELPKYSHQIRECVRCRNANEPNRRVGICCLRQHERDRHASERMYWIPIKAINNC